MSNVSAPYRFVPLSSLVVLPDWADRVSHDVPLADGLCGELRLTLTTHTALCVGGAQDKATERTPGKVHFFRTPSGDLAIPGSSLKGMLRNVLEIASFSRFQQVEDQRLGVRDISQSANFYTREILARPVQAGWLSFRNGAWQIAPCAFSRIHQADLIRACGLDTENWKRAKTVTARYALTGLDRTLRFHTEVMKRSKHLQGKPAADGACEGTLVMSGQPGKPFDGGKSAKKYEFLFHQESTDKLLIIERDVMAGFLRIHEQSSEWQFWNEKLRGGALAKGIPVFFHRDGQKVTSLGLSMMYKIPYRHSLHQAIRHTADAHLDNISPDLAALIFGHLDDTPGASLRSRINVGLAALSDPAATDWTSPTVLNSPKPTFYPAYVRQKHDREPCQLMQPDAELAGWKRYPAKPEKVLKAPDKSGSKVQVQLETVPAGTRFHFAIRLHNLRPAELGALLWCLDFGGRPALRHGLGMGKPYGLGQVSLQIDGAQLRHNDPVRESADHDEVLLACRDSFIDMMDQALAQSAPDEKNWETCGPIVALLDHARPGERATDLDYLPDPKLFVQLKHSDALQDIQQTFHKDKPVNASMLATGATHRYEDHFDQLLADAPQRRQAAAEKAELARKMAEASEEDRELLQLETLLADAGNTLSATQKKNLNKALTRLYEISVNMDQTQRATLRQLAVRANVLGDKKIQHIVKKIMAMFGS